MLLGLCACGENKEIDDGNIGSKPVIEPDPEPEPDPIYNQYTGLEIEEDLSAVRPYAIMINNIKTATPQVGICDADIIYEVLVEGGITRLMGIFQDVSDTGVIGSIRSSRPYYLDIAQGYDAIYIHAGGSEDAYSQMSKRGMDHLDGVRGSADFFYRDAQRKKSMGYEHSLMIDCTKMDNYIADHNYRTELGEAYRNVLEFTDEPMTEGATAGAIKVTFSKSKITSFEYDASQGKYLVSEYGKAMTDNGHDGAQLAVRNVLVLEASMGLISGDEAGRLTGKLTGSGKGSYFCGGIQVPITWYKASATTPYSYTLENGQPLKLARGNSYICISAPSFGSYSFE